MHVYLHIPFCHRICPYCSFFKHTPGKTDLARFVSALVQEATTRSRLLANPPVPTLYLGGGTPSMLSPGHLRRLLEGLRASLDLVEGCEITLEANPATFTDRTAALYRELGITRVSLGVQSFQGEQLRTLGREHTPEEARHSFALLRSAGIPSINIDLMFSVPGQSLANWSATLEAALALRPDHLSAYNLTYEEDTPFFDRLGQPGYQDEPERNEEFFLLTHEQTKAAGYRHYETSNYAQPGHESRHNQAYWEGADYLGLGPSAVSTIGNRRWKNIPDTDHYLAMIERFGHAMSEEEHLRADQLRLERIALLLRTDRGVPLDQLVDVSPSRVSQVTGEGLAVVRGDRLVLSGRGPLLVDAITEHLVS